MAAGTGRNIPMLLSHFKMVDMMEPADELRNKAMEVYGDHFHFGVEYAETF
jgi:mannose/fructose-specific phosphotransferase system component IIA|tara:strand:+ start:315 stop:467 length:153 start_codon:yes stop_codon:yes gene_type:complete